MTAPRLAPLFFCLAFAWPLAAAAQDDFDAAFGDSPARPAPAPTPAPTPAPDPFFDEPAASPRPDEGAGAEAPGDSPASSEAGDGAGAASSEPAAETGDAGQAEAALEAEAAIEAEAAGEDAAASPEAGALDQRLFLGQSSYYGPIGGVHVVDAGGGAVGTFRLGLMADFFSARSFHERGDHQKHFGGAIPLSVTPHRMVEVFAAYQSYANSNDRGDPELLQVFGDALVGVKVFGRIHPIFTVGGDASLSILNTVGDIGAVLRSTSAGLRVNGTADLRGRARPIPFVARFNAQYWFDNSKNLVSDVEARRYGGLSDPADPADEVRHLVTPVERFGLTINRTDFVRIGAGFEAPFALRRVPLVSPLLEWRWSIPVNRQGFDCAFLPASPGSDRPAAGQDGCLDVQGAKAFPMELTLGVRVSPIRGLGLIAAADVGLTGVRTAVRELAATPPYAIILGASYGYDPSPAPVAEEAAPAPEPAPEPVPLYTHARLHGLVVSAGDAEGEGAGEAAGGAVVGFGERPLNALIAGEDGAFLSYRFAAGEEVSLTLSHPDYEPGVCLATVPEAPIVSGAADAMPDGVVLPPEGETEGPRLDEAGDLILALRCELSPLPRAASLAARVTDEEGAPLAGVTVQLEGPETHTLTSDAQGRLVLEALAPGEYTARIDHEGFLLKVQPITAVAREEAQPELSLVRRARRALASVQGRRISIRRQVSFASNSAEILPVSDALLYEIVDVFLRNPELTRVEIQGHTDDRGGSARNVALSQDRADAVRNWLIAHGVEASRVEARGYGASQPLVPNITTANRARNRRVQFVIKSSD